MEAQNNILSVLGLFHCVHFHLFIVKGDKTLKVCLRPSGSRFHGVIERTCLLHGTSLHKIPAVWQKGIGKGVHTLVLQMVRLQTGTQKGNADHIILDVMSVFAVIQKADAVISLGEVSKTVGNALKSGLIPACVPVVWAPHIAVLYIIGCIGGADIHRESSL